MSYRTRPRGREPMERHALTAQLRARAHDLGFALVGVTAPDPSGYMDFYRDWIESGYHGEMGYLAREDSIERRADLTKTMAETASVVVVAHEYFQEDPEGLAADPSRAVIARYARGEDYHFVLKRKLEELLGWLDDHVEGGVRGRSYVDTGPILERDLARRAGLGWFGKNTMLINPDRGSYFFLGLLLVDVRLQHDGPFEQDRCGTCHACLDACPTGALLGRDDEGAPVMDARRCISYLTIELRGTIPRDLRGPIGNRVFGCDICQEVCPWNESFARAATEEAYTARDDLDGPALMDLALRLLGTDDAGFREAFRDSPLSRAGRAGLLRNICVALGNWSDPEAVPVLADALSDRDAVVRGHAAWALGEIGVSSAWKALQARDSIEMDEGVGNELAEALRGRPTA